MNTCSKIPAIIILLISSTLIFTSCKKKPTPPVVTTTSVTAITQTTATSGGNVTGDGGAEVTSRGVCWNTSENPTTSNSKTSDGKGTGSFTSNLTSLTPGTKYYVRAYATNEAGTDYGNQVSFTTGEIVLATVSTTPATSVTATTAVSGGNITSDGGSAITARGVCWSINQNPTIADSKTIDGSGTGTFTSSITGLTDGTTYYVRAYATNSTGTVYGNQESFTTSQNITTPSITTSPITNITTNSATGGGNVTASGGATVTARGVCWNTTQNPTIAHSKTIDGSGTGTFTSSITSLTPGTTYYVRAYATNSAGTTYGDQRSFPTTPSVGAIVFNPSLTYGTVTDIEGNVYKTIQVGTQVWMAENLRTTKYNDDTSIPLVTDNTAWKNLITPGYCWYDNDPITYKSVYGALYNWYAASSGKLCPTGWHVLTEDEYEVLVIYLGGLSDAGGKLKETGLTHWISPNTGATNETGITGLPGGRRYYDDGTFISIGELGYYWTSTEDEVIWGSMGILHYDSAVLEPDGYSKPNGMSVRCIKD